MSRSVNARVVARPGESVDKVYRRFKRSVVASRLLHEWERAAHYEKPSDKRRKGRKHRE